jgi:hypothetical protein
VQKHLREIEEKDEKYKAKKDIIIALQNQIEELKNAAVEEGSRSKNNNKHGQAREDERTTNNTNHVASQKQSDHIKSLKLQLQEMINKNEVLINEKEEILQLVTSSTAANNEANSNQLKLVKERMTTGVMLARSLQMKIDELNRKNEDLEVEKRNEIAMLEETCDAAVQEIDLLQAKVEGLEKSSMEKDEVIKKMNIKLSHKYNDSLKNTFNTNITNNNKNNDDSTSGHNVIVNSTRSYFDVGEVEKENMILKEKIKKQDEYMKSQIEKARNVREILRETNFLASECRGNNKLKF